MIVEAERRGETHILLSTKSFEEVLSILISPTVIYISHFIMTIFKTRDQFYFFPVTSSYK